MSEEDEYAKDMVPFSPGEHDVRIPRGDWVFYVRAVRRGSAVRGGGSVLPGDPVELLMLLSLGAVSAFVDHRLRWKVAVVRGPSPRSWKTDRLRILHKELLAAGGSPEQRVEELADEVRAGRFDSSD